MAIQFIGEGQTDVGLKRSENEDTFLLIPEQGLYILADGMGGHSSGKLASTLAVKFIASFVEQHKRGTTSDLPFKTDPHLPFAANLLSSAIKFANERIFIQSCKDRALEGMGTTITAILQMPHQLAIAHVGDSRIYRQRHGKLKQLTDDHSLFNHLLKTGELQPHEISNFTRSNVILRAIGLKDYVDVDVQVVEQQGGDLFMMCSDGLSDLVSDPIIQNTIQRESTLPQICNKLIQLALNEGGKDNVTVVCLKLEGTLETQPKEPDRSTQKTQRAIPIPQTTAAPNFSRQRKSGAYKTGSPPPPYQSPFKNNPMRSGARGATPRSTGSPPPYSSSFQNNPTRPNLPRPQTTPTPTPTNKAPASYSDAYPHATRRPLMTLEEAIQEANSTPQQRREPPPQQTTQNSSPKLPQPRPPSPRAASFPQSHSPTFQQTPQKTPQKTPQRHPSVARNAYQAIPPNNDFEEQDANALRPPSKRNLKTPHTQRFPTEKSRARTSLSPTSSQQGPKTEPDLEAIQPNRRWKKR